MILTLILAFLRPGLDFGSALGGTVGGLIEAVGGHSLARPDYYTPGGTQTADQDFMQALQAISAATNRNTGMIDPTLLHAYSQMLGIDVSGLIPAGAQAGGQYSQLAGQMAGAGSTMAAGGNQIMNQAFDPQNQLHDFQRQQTIDTSRAADTSRGLAMSPYSSGNESTAARNFEMDWQNRQLGREAQGIAGANAAYGGAQTYGGAAPGYTMAGAQAPIAGQQAAYGAPMGFAQQFLGAENNMFAPQAGMMSMAFPYLEYGTNAGSNIYNQRYNRDIQSTNMMSQGMAESFYGYGAQGSGAGNPASYMGMGMGGGMAGMSGMGPG